MTTMTKTEDVKVMMEEMLKDEALMAELQNAASFEEAAEVFKVHGIEVSAEELRANCASLQSAMIPQGGDGELSDADLELVAGGKIGVKKRTYVYYGGALAGVGGAILCGGPVTWAAAGVACGALALASMLH